MRHHAWGPRSATVDVELLHEHVGEDHRRTVAEACLGDGSAKSTEPPRDKNRLAQFSGDWSCRSFSRSFAGNLFMMIFMTHSAARCNSS